MEGSHNPFLIDRFARTFPRKTINRNREVTPINPIKGGAAFSLSFRIGLFFGLLFDGSHKRKGWDSLF